MRPGSARRPAFPTGVGGADARLIDYDRRHRSNRVETLRAGLDAFGDVVAAADALLWRAAPR